MRKGGCIVLGVLVLFSVLCVILPFVLANSYIADLSFTLPRGVYSTNERIEIAGLLQVKNYTNSGTLVSGLAPLVNASVNLTLRNSTANVTVYNFTTDVLGRFFSRSNFYPAASLISAPSTSGDYYLRAEYLDLNGTFWHSEVSFKVINESLEEMRVSPGSNLYNPSDTMIITAESFRRAADKIVYVGNVSVNGSIRNVTSKAVLSSFNCTTGVNGKCSVSVSAPTAYGEYIVELNNFKSFSNFKVIPFTALVTMKDNLGKSSKNTFALDEKASIEVSVVTNSTSDNYYFSGYISDSNGNVVKTVNVTSLSSNNSYTNKFSFTVDSLSFAYGSYYSKITVTKQGDGSIELFTSFEVKDWTISLSKRTESSGFEYDFVAFPNKTLYLEAYPKYRNNGTIIPTLNQSDFRVNLTDTLGNTFKNANVSWNATCAKEGCYQFSMSSPNMTGRYNLLVTLSTQGAIQTTRRTIYVTDSVLSAQSTNTDGAVKELFGTGEFVYISLSSYNSTSRALNVSDAQIFSITFMNGSELNYSNVSVFDSVNATNNASEWVWNETLQRFKLDVPKAGGVYSVQIFANNESVAANAKFVVNPYDICTVAKNTPSSSVSSSNNAYYVWQFKTTDTVYFELKVIQASNPLGKAAASNFSSGNTSSQYGLSSSCGVDTTTQQVVSNATVSLIKVINTNNGVQYSLNTTNSVCVSSDNQGGYTCTVTPAVKWDGGTYAAEMLVSGLDGSSDIAYGLFEAKAFYLYGYSNSWQNGPDSNLTLTLRMYEAGTNWWGNYGSGGLSGTITLEKIEYMGKDGEWVWPPVDSGYNTSQVNSTNVSTGSGSMTLPVSLTKKGKWDTGNYRIIIKGVDSGGNVDYGYAWFSVKRWDVYGMPIECTASNCNYKSYFNSRENVTLYIKVSSANTYNYNEQGGASIGGNITIKVKKLQDCRSSPCRELNSSDYSATLIAVNSSSPWYWNKNASTIGNYTIYINKSDGLWGTGWFSVLLDINGTETGQAWFNTIAFYVNAQPTNITGTSWKYNIKPQESSYFNVSVTKGFTYNNAVANKSNYVNASINETVLRLWDSTTYRTREFRYPTDINVTVVNYTSPLRIDGNALVNVTYLNGSWPTGYYNGELKLKDANNEISTAWLWFSVQPFRVEVSQSSYDTDEDACINATFTIREPDWYNNGVIQGNYSLVSVTETIWGGGSQSITTYTNFTNTTFITNSSLRFCPNSANWGIGNWGGYHSLNAVVKNANDNSTQAGWLSFRAVPFKVTWTIQGGSTRMTNDNVNFTANLTRLVGNTPASGNLTQVYQWRYDSSTSYSSSRQTYDFTVHYGNGVTCSSSSGTGNCLVNRTVTAVTINAPSAGWKVGSNYLYAEWTSNSGASVQDYNGAYFTGAEAYNGYFYVSDANGVYRGNFAPSENVTLYLVVRNSSYSNSAVNITSVSYGMYGSNCYSDSCTSFTTAGWSISLGGGTGTNFSSGTGVVRLHMPSGGWNKGSYTARVVVSGPLGSSTITGGSFRVSDNIYPNVTISSPTMNQTVTSNSLSFSATTTESTQCSIMTLSYATFQTWMNCPTVLTSSNSTASGFRDACNSTYYGISNNTSYQYEYISRDSYSFYNNSLSDWKSGSFLSTGGTTHTYTMNLTRWINQSYGIKVSCWDSDYLTGEAYVSLRVNK